MNFAEHLTADRRLVLLRMLAEQIAYKANSTVLTHRIDQLGHAMSRDQVKTQLYWLAEQDLVSLDEPVPGVLVATLTARGMEVAKGYVVAPGVSRPGA
jgi:hypothetical protein